MPCNKTNCLKQVNPKISGLYFGVPFERDENRMECYLCDKEEKKEGGQVEPLLSNRFTRVSPSL